MGRRASRGEYLTTADYALGWGDNRSTWSEGLGGNKNEARQHAADLVEQMRREGAASAIRRIRVRHWPDGASLADAPVLYEASYYDPEQCLTAAEAYASYVHEWHEFPDRFNRNHAANDSPFRVGYASWTGDWGPEPTSCPACSADLIGGPLASAGQAVVPPHGLSQ